MVFQLNCYPCCSAADPTQDTVKFDASRMEEHDKENLPLNPMAAQCKPNPDMEEGDKPNPDMEEEGTAIATLAEDQLAADRARCAEADGGEVKAGYASTAEEDKLAAEQLAADKARSEEEDRGEIETVAASAAEEDKLAAEQLAGDEPRCEEEDGAAKRDDVESLQKEAAVRGNEEADAGPVADQREQTDERREVAETEENLCHEEPRQAPEAEHPSQETEQAEVEVAQSKALAYLAAHKFTDVNALRKSTWKAKRPLHSAVKRNDVDIIRCLLLARADPTLTNSKGQTPQQVALALDKKGSHSAVLAVLSEDP